MDGIHRYSKSTIYLFKPLPSAQNIYQLYTTCTVLAVPMQPLLTGSTTMPAPFRTASLTIWQARRTLVALSAPTANCISASLNRPARSGGEHVITIATIRRRGMVVSLTGHGLSIYYKAIFRQRHLLVSLPGHDSIDPVAFNRRPR